MSQTSLIEFRRVTYTYPHLHEPGQDYGRPALDRLDFTVQAGEYLAVLGHNGSGKSTMARHCNALLTPQTGSVLVNGLDTCEQASLQTIRDTVGMIFQQPENQIISTIVEDDVAWALTVRGLPLALIRERVEDALELVGLSQQRQRSPQQLSGGQRQRLAIAGVLALRPQCIIADEATSQLDPLSRREIIALLHRLHQEYGLTIIHVTHLLEEVVAADRIVIMEQGRVSWQGTPATIFADLPRLRALKLSVPEPLELAERLRQAGIPLTSTALTEAAIAEELSR
jgi:energy-coupling factor transport system ATP-binding protein